MVLSLFHPVIANWFVGRFGSPTDVQARCWPAIASGTDLLIAAPTGSGKTLAAFLSCLDSLFKQALAGELEDRTQVLYVSPLKALSNDVQKNLQQPLAEIANAAMAAGLLMPEIRVTVRTGDTPAWDRQLMLRRPPHILITTPESLYLLLTAEKSRRILQDVRTVIVDEIHAVAPNKRGAHLALSLERLEAETPTRPVRIGLSATQRPIETIAKLLVGSSRITHLRAGLSAEGFGPSHGFGRRVGPQAEAPFIAQARHPPRIVDIGHRRQMDLAVEVPKDELGAVATNAIWSDVYDRVADLVREHRSCLVFVNTRRLAERVAHHLEERLGGQVVAAHHGSLSRQIRLSAEERLKRGETRVVVATASLELGIDVGTVDLVCQIGSPRAIATCLQRVGRSGHWVGALPKGRLFATTRDELLECAALVRAIRSGTLDRLDVPDAPMDILAQQIVATVATREWQEDELFQLCRRAYPYRGLDRKDFDAVVRMLADGIDTRRGRGRAYLHHDRVNRRLRARRGARLAAITSGGAIPDTANYAVIAEPGGMVVGSVDEDFAVESLAGDIILLGNASWRIRGVETGKVRVEDAHGAPPTIPFWRGEAPSRTQELSAEVAAIRQEIAKRLPSPAISYQPSAISSPETAISHQPFDRLRAPSKVEGLSAISWLEADCGLDRRGAEQAVAYVAAGRAVLGVVPTQQTIIAERFFDEGGGMQLVLHAPFGGRLNRAWGLALRKRFCVTFDFELQAAATDEGIVISLGERHSFPLESVFGFLRADTVREVLTQAILAAPMFASRWRWNATRALALLRFANGRRVPPQIQRMRAEDLLAAVFPSALACQENQQGAVTVPGHPLVQETVRDCLTEAMDVDGLTALLRRIERGEIRCLAVDTPSPSPFCHEILNANPYAYLDDAPLEERRARAVEMRRSLPPELAGNLGALDPAAIAEVAEESWPVVRDADELHDALLTLIWVPEDHPAVQREKWGTYLQPLLDSGRATRFEVRGAGPATIHNSTLKIQNSGWVATERLGSVRAVFPEAAFSPKVGEMGETRPERGEALLTIVQGWLESTGPTTAEELAEKLTLSTEDVDSVLLQLESQGQVLRGRFRATAQTSGDGREAMGEAKSSGPLPRASGLLPAASADALSVEWCDRRLLARIHRLTIGKLRREIEPVTAAEFMRFLFQWQHVAPGSRLHGAAGLLEVVRQLAGFEAAASAWERHLLPLRIGKYEPELLDRLCLNGSVMWGRLTPHPRLDLEPDAGRSRRIVPSSVAPISLFPREEAEWLLGLSGEGRGEGVMPVLSPIAQDLRCYLQARGASFFADLTRDTGHLQSEVEDGLWELAAAGLVTADGFDNLRALLDPRRRRAQGRERARRPRHGAGRWSLLRVGTGSRLSLATAGACPVPGDSPSTRRNRNGDGCQEMGQSPVEQIARQLLRRYGVMFRDLLGRESQSLAWRDLLVQYRRMESRGEIRGGRFVGGFTGEQFALPAAVEALRAMRRASPGAGTAQELRISAADPLNLAGVILPGPRVPAVPTNYVVFRDGIPVRSGAMPDPGRSDSPPSSLTEVGRSEAREEIN
jgi:ATP-dependent helicase Lhr and Lhr-like helicase